MSPCAHYDVCISLQRQSKYTWDRTSLADSHNLQLNEEGITENILLNIADSLSPSNAKVRAFSKSEEKIIGADFLISFSGPSSPKFPHGKIISVLFQAKRLFIKDKKYNGLITSFGDGEDQFERLENILLNPTMRMIPVYLLYNSMGFDYSGRHFDTCRNCCIPHHKSWGCSIAPLWVVKNRHQPKPSDLCPLYPWHLLFRPSLIDPSGCFNDAKLSLPDCVGQSLRAMYSDALDIDEAVLDKLFTPNTDASDWVTSLDKVLAKKSDAGAQEEDPDSSAEREMCEMMDDLGISHFMHIQQGKNNDHDE